MSAMKLEKNGTKSVGQCTQHIHIRYFFFCDRIANHEITLLHCPNSTMVADYFTKPSGGTSVHFRAIIMGHTHFSHLAPPDPPILTSVLEKPVFTKKLQQDLTFSLPTKPVTHQTTPQLHANSKISKVKQH
jgi:hypothetical protein